MVIEYFDICDGCGLNITDEKQQVTAIIDDTVCHFCGDRCYRHYLSLDGWGNPPKGGDLDATT